MNCSWCGAYIGEGRNNSREPESCGEPECDRECRDMYRQMQSDAQEAAAADDYERYR